MGECLIRQNQKKIRFFSETGNFLLINTNI
jgi:hypothetical protein